MSDIAALAAWSAQHHGVVTSATLATLGLSRQNLETLVARGLLRREVRGVFVVVAVPPTTRQRLAIATAATDGVVSRVAAGRLWRYRKLPAGEAVDVTIEHRRTIAADAVPTWVRIHRTRNLADEDIVRRDDGIAVTSPPRTVFDLAAVLGAEALESVIEQGIDRESFGIPTLWGVARRLARRGRAGSSRFVEVLASRPIWQRPAGSDDELVLARALESVGLPTPLRQVPIELPDGRIVHPDLVWPDARLVVEVDHVTWHGGRVDNAYDKRRDRQLRRRGWHVERVPNDELRDQLAVTCAEIAEIHWERLALLRRLAA